MSFCRVKYELTTLAPLFLLVMAIQISNAQPVTITPKRAYDYYNEVGVNTHLSWDTSVYFTQFDAVIYPELQRLGIKNVRDELPYYRFMRLADTGLVTGRFQKLHDSLGINMCYVLTSWLVIDSPSQRDSANYLSVLENSPGLRNATKYMEGYNEPDMNIWNSYPSSWDTLTYAMQKGLYVRMQAGILSSIPTLSPSFIEYWTVPSRTNEIAAITPHISTYFDYANFHTYDTGADSTTMFPGSYYDITGARLDTIRHTRPWAITEAGYENARLWNVPYTPSYNVYDSHYLSELASAKYYSVLFMELFGRGAKSIYTYELIDGNTADSADFEQNYGLLHTDGTEKPAFTVVRNTLALFRDTGAAFSPAPLSFTLTGDTTGIKYAVYQKYNGDYLVALWQGRSVGICYSFLTFTDLQPDSQAVQLTLPFPCPAANVYQPLYANAPIYTYSNTSVLNLNVPDHLLVVEIKASLLAAPDLLRKDALGIYPNPANDRFYVHGLKAGGETFHIYAPDGRLVKQGTVGADKPEINCAQLLPGCYLLKLKNRDGVTDLVTRVSVMR